MGHPDWLAMVATAFLGTLNLLFIGMRGDLRDLKNKFIEHLENHP